jgi:hypothetical protein
MATLSGIITPSNVLTESSTATLTNKTIAFSGNTFTGALPTANGGTGLTALGTAGQVLTVNTGATALEFAAPSAGLTLLATITASASSSIDIEDVFTSTYDNYIILVTSAKCSTNSNSFIKVRFKISGTYRDTNYRWFRTTQNSSSTTYNGDSNNSDTEIRCSADNNNGSADSLDMVFEINNPTSTALHKQIKWSIIGNNNSGNQYTTGSGINNGTPAALTGVRIQPNAGNFSSGVFRIYGVRK